ncbi:TPA: hypothetical protein JRS25_004098 [Escherichia coli]|nr:hypothetical protein [Escherichia coli]
MHSLKVGVIEAKDLNSLCLALNSLCIAIEEHNGSMCDVVEVELSDFVDISNLPVFGGDSPSCTCGIYSWDNDNYLMMNITNPSESDFKIYPRIEVDNE